MKREISSQLRIVEMAALDTRRNIIQDLLLQRQKGTENFHCDLRWDPVRNGLLLNRILKLEGI